MRGIGHELALAVKRRREAIKETVERSRKKAKLVVGIGCVKPRVGIALRDRARLAGQDCQRSKRLTSDDPAAYRGHDERDEHAGTKREEQSLTFGLDVFQ